MPYITPDRRTALQAGEAPRNAGELNYTLTKIIDAYLVNQGGVRYAHLNEVVGAIECVKQELYRRVAAPYEDEKIQEHGDVYDVLED